MTACLADNYEGVELILRIVLGKDLQIKSVRTQEVLKNLQGRSTTLDVNAVDSDNKEMDIEIQYCGGDVSCFFFKSAAMTILRWTMKPRNCSVSV